MTATAIYQVAGIVAMCLVAYCYVRALGMGRG